MRHLLPDIRMFDIMPTHQLHGLSAHAGGVPWQTHHRPPLLRGSVHKCRQGRGKGERKGCAQLVTCKSLRATQQIHACCAGFWLAGGPLSDRHAGVRGSHCEGLEQPRVHTGSPGRVDQAEDTQAHARAGGCRWGICSWKCAAIHDECTKVQTMQLDVTAVLLSKTACLRMHADWVDHVLETGGEAYLRSPVDDLNVFVRHSLDTYSFLLGCSGVLLYLAWQLINAAALSYRALLHRRAKVA